MPIVLCFSRDRPFLAIGAIIKNLAHFPKDNVANISIGGKNKISKLSQQTKPNHHTSDSKTQVHVHV